ncbi:MAG: hypothetical protein AB7M93_17190 [Candidatus Obscuribacterales bacterium]
MPSDKIRGFSLLMPSDKIQGFSLLMPSDKIRGFSLDAIGQNPGILSPDAIGQNPGILSSHAIKLCHSETRMEAWRKLKVFEREWIVWRLEKARVLKRRRSASSNRDPEQAKRGSWGLSGKLGKDKR